MDFKDFSLIKVTDSTLIKPFDCGDEDLNEFLTQKSIHYSNELLAASFILEDSENTIAFFSIFNDSLKVQEKNFASKSAFKRFLAEIATHPKRHLEYFPAIKIGRLAVNNTIKSNGIGKKIVNYIINLGIEQNNICACKFITVDAYDISLGFYEKMGFKYLSELDAGKDTRQMYLDLTPILNYINSGMTNNISQQ